MTHLDLKDALLVLHGDGAWANAPKARSQAGLLVALTESSALHGECPASCLEWKSHRLRRALKSSLAVEAAGIDTAVDHGVYFGFFLGELVDTDFIATRGDASPIPFVAVTDAKSLYDAVRRLSNSFAEKRVQIDVAAIRGSHIKKKFKSNQKN